MAKAYENNEKIKNLRYKRMMSKILIAGFSFISIIYIIGNIYTIKLEYDKAKEKRVEINTKSKVQTTISKTEYVFSAKASLEEEEYYEEEKIKEIEKDSAKTEEEKKALIEEIRKEYNKNERNERRKNRYKYSKIKTKDPKEEKIVVIDYEAQINTEAKVSSLVYTFKTTNKDILEKEKSKYEKEENYKKESEAEKDGIYVITYKVAEMELKRIEELTQYLKSRFTLSTFEYRKLEYSDKTKESTEKIEKEDIKRSKEKH